MNFEMEKIGTIDAADGYRVVLDKKFVPGLTGLEGFSYVHIFWYADKAPVWNDTMLVMPAPYRGSPEKIGVFATRTPIRLMVYVPVLLVSVL